MSERILVVGPAWVGDMVMAQSLCMTLVARPGTVVDMLAPGWSLPLIERMPEVNGGIAIPVGHGELAWRTRRRIGRRLRSRGYGRAIVLPRSFKSAFVPWHARIPVRTGYRGEMRFGLLNDIRRLDPSLRHSRLVSVDYTANAATVEVVGLERWPGTVTPAFGMPFEEVEVAPFIAQQGDVAAQPSPASKGDAVLLLD